MIKAYIDRLVAAYPAQVTALENAVDALMPFAMLALIFWLVWQLLCMVDRMIDRSEAKRIAKAREPQYRTADARQIQRETEQLWRRTPDAKGASWEPWRDTMPPAEPAAPRHRVRAGSPTVVPFPPANAERRRQP